MAAALAARELERDVTICVPETTPVLVREKLQAMGAEVVVHGSVSFCPPPLLPLKCSCEFMMHSIKCAQNYFLMKHCVVLQYIRIVIIPTPVTCQNNFSLGMREFFLSVHVISSTARAYLVMGQQPDVCHSVFPCCDALATVPIRNASSLVC